MTVNTINGFRQNPLRVLTPEQLDDQVAKFAVEHRLLDLLHILRQGAQIARSPHGSTVFHELSPENQQALIDENHHPFRNPIRYWIAIAFACCAAALQGSAQVGFVPGNGRWEGLDQHSPRNGQDMKIGLVSSIPYFTASLLGCWLSEPLNERFGRRGPLLVGALVNLAAAFGAAFSQSWQQVLICRIFTGISMGLKASVAPMFAAELSPASIRGSTVMGAWQICVAFGVLFGYSAALIAQHWEGDYWRYQIASPFILSLPVIALYFACVESPRWLIKKGRYRAAYNTLRKIRNSDIQAARDLFAVVVQIRLEEELLQIDAANTPYHRKLTQLFTDSRNRAAVVASGVIMFCQQLCGINVIIFFGFTLFSGSHEEASGRTSRSLWALWVVGLVNMLLGLPGLYFSDRVGRRRLLLGLYPPMCVFMLCAGLAYMIPHNEVRTKVISVFIVLFVASYSPGQGPIAFLYASESFPVTHREPGMSLSVAINLFWAGVLALVYPRLNVALNDDLHLDGTSSNSVNKPNYVLIVFGLLNLVAMGLVYLLCPETKLYTLEELDEIFAYDVHEHAIGKIGDLKSRILRQS